MLEINEDNLHSELLKYKNQIGFGIADGILLIASGLAFVCTIISGKIESLSLNIIFWLFAGLQIIWGVYQIIVSFKTKFNAEKLFSKIKDLDVSPHRYSLIAIRDEFMGYKSNRVLAKLFEGEWDEYMFLSFPTAVERDEESLTTALAGSLKIPPNRIHLFPKASVYQPKQSKDWKKVRAYYNTYYVASIDYFPELLKNDEFDIDNVHYKWMTLEQMENEATHKDNNMDVRKTFSRFIYTPNKLIDTNIERFTKLPQFPYNVCIRLNRTCSLSCQFCLACHDSSLSLGTDAAKQCLSILKNNGVKRARLGGGEPTLHPGLIEIIKYSLDLGMDTIVYSNLYDVDSVLPEIVKYPVSVVTSIHGDADFHDSITGVKGSYQQTYDNIAKLIASGIQTSIHIVLMPNNVDLVEYVIQEAIKLGVHKVTIQTLIPREKGKDFIAQNNLSILNLRNNLEKVKKIGNQYKGQINIHYNDMYEKDYYVLEPDGSIYLESGNGSTDQLIRRLI